MKKSIKIEGMSCNHCKQRVENTLLEMPGIEKAKVNLAKKEAVITCAENVSDAEIKSKVEELGFSVTEITEKKGLF